MATKNSEKTEDKNKPEIYKKKCPYCDKLFYSLNEKQILFNYTSHIGSCKFKNEKNDSIKETNKKSKEGKK